MLIIKKPKTELEIYVKNMLKQGYSKEQIRTALIKTGHDVNTVNKSLKK